MSAHTFHDGECQDCGCAECYEWPCPGPLVDRAVSCTVTGCSNEVSCVGSYDGAPEAYACDEHCGHGNEGGWCGPGDLDKMRWSLAESATIGTEDIIEHSGVPNDRARAALDELVGRGEVTFARGHHHNMDGDLCQCFAGEVAGLPRLTHWYSSHGDPS